MIVSIKENKFQVFISTILGFLYFMKTKDEVFSIILVLGSALILRSLKFDSLVNKFLNKKENFLNFKTAAERNQFCKSMFNASSIASQNENAKKWDESKSYLKALQKTKTELTTWNTKYNKNKNKI